MAKNKKRSLNETESCEESESADVNSELLNVKFSTCNTGIYEKYYNITKENDEIAGKCLLCEKNKKMKYTY